MPNDLDVFHFDDDRPNFEGFAHENGFRYWLASDLMELLGYSTMQPILNAVNRAMSACGQLEIPFEENFAPTKTETGGKDWRLSRFACYLTVMNGDPKKPKVAQAQAYFAAMTEAFRQQIQDGENVERVAIRGDISEREKALAGTVNQRGVETFAFFQNAGYRGMYNLDLKGVRVRKRVPGDRSPLDFMGKTELAANLFRITQTEEKIRNEDLIGQKPLERAAETVGRAVRKTMFEVSGTRPEDLPPANDIRDVKKGLKGARRDFKKLDGQRRVAQSAS